jgi:hypothetical protein
MEIKLVHYIGMTFVVSEMPQDVPIMSGVVTQSGELRTFWRDPEYRGDDKMTSKLFLEIGKAMVTGEIPMPIFAFIHPDNEASNKLVAKFGFQMKKVLRDNAEWNAWFINDELMGIVMDFRKRYLSAISDDDKQTALSEFVKDFEKAVKNKTRLGEAVKVK